LLFPQIHARQETCQWWFSKQPPTSVRSKQEGQQAAGLGFQKQTLECSKYHSRSSLGAGGWENFKIETSLLHRTRESQMPNHTIGRSQKSVIPISFLRFLQLLAEDSVFVSEPFFRARFVVPFHRCFNVGLLFCWRLSYRSSVQRVANSCRLAQG
jgi:hypothetical protein